MMIRALRHAPTWRIQHWVDGIAGDWTRSIGTGVCHRNLDSERKHQCKMRDSFGYCVQQVKDFDYENYLWCTQLKKELRPTIFALRAFNVETSMIEGHAKGEMMILMRCKWWKDALNSAFKGNAPDQPVIAALQEVIRQVPLTRYRMQRILSAKEEDWIRSDPIKNVSTLHEFVDSTLVQLQLLQYEAIHGITQMDQSSSREGDMNKNEEDVLQAAIHVGKGVGLTLLLRDTARSAQRHRTYLPLDLCEKYGANIDDIFSGKLSDPLKLVIEEVATEAEMHLHAARSLRPSLPDEHRFAMLPATAASMYLKALKSLKYDLYDIRMKDGGYSMLKYQLKLKLNAVMGYY